MLDEAEASGVPCGVASSSTSDWVFGYLERFGLSSRFKTVVTRDMVAQPKPAPDLYLEACRRLGVSPAEAVALEDSVNGVKAANAAGLASVAVPNGITGSFDFSHADAVLETLEGMTVARLADLVLSGRSPARP